MYIENADAELTLKQVQGDIFSMINPRGMSEKADAELSLLTNGI